MERGERIEEQEKGGKDGRIEGEGRWGGGRMGGREGGGRMGGRRRGRAEGRNEHTNERTKKEEKKPQQPTISTHFSLIPDFQTYFIYIAIAGSSVHNQRKCFRFKLEAMQGFKSSDLSAI